MSVTDRIEAAHHARLRLLELGYVPLPNQDKRLFVPGWPDVEVTRAWLERHRGTKYQAAGLRMHDHLMAIDVDVDDKDIVEEIWNTLTAETPELANCLIRHSGANKEMWILRSSEPFGFASSAKYVAPDDDPEDPDAPKVQVEVFGGQARKQIAVFGVHTINPESPALDPLRMYDYDGPSILDTPYAELPVMPIEAVMRISMRFGDLMEARGWHRARHFGAPGDGHTVEYDLDTDGSFVTASGEVTYAQLAHEDSCRMLEITGEGRNTDRGRVYDFGEHTGVWDSETHVVHLPIEAAPEEIGDAAARLADRLRETGHGRSMDEYAAAMADFVEGQEDREALMQHLTENYVVYPAGKADERIRGVNSPEEVYSKDGFRDLYSETVEIDQGTYQRATGEHEAGDPKPPKKVPLVDIWLRSDLPTKIHGVRFFPGVVERIHEIGGKDYLNFYQPPEVGVVDPALERIWEDLLDHLFSEEGAREDVENWIAYKVQNLASRGKLQVWVSDEEGTGRGTLTTILAHLFGMGNSRTGLGTEYITGKGAGVYTDIFHDRLFMSFDEVSTTESARSGQARRQLYDRMKSLFEVTPNEMTTRAIYQKPRTDRCYVSAVVSTQHRDALPLDTQSGNRRVQVWNTGRNGPLARHPKLEQDLEKIRRGAWFNPDMTATLLDRYSDWEVCEADFLKARATTLAEEMAYHNADPVELALGEVLDQIDGQYCMPQLVQEAVRRKLEHEGMAQFISWVPNAVGRLLGKDCGFHGWKKMPRKVRLKSNPAAWVYARCRPPEKVLPTPLSAADFDFTLRRFMAATVEEREAMLASGLK